MEISKSRAIEKLESHDFRRIGFVGVDSGQVMVGDPCYLSDWADDEFASDGDRREPYDYSYSGACNATLSDIGGGELGRNLSVASRTYWGDGIYPVYQVLDGDGEVAGLFVDFSGILTNDEYLDDEEAY